MDKQALESDRKLTRQEISDAVTDLGWRYILGVVRTSVRVGSLVQAAAVVEHVILGMPAEVDGYLQADVRVDRVILTLQSPAAPMMTRREVGLVAPISAIVADLGLRTNADIDDRIARSLQVLEIAIDALDISSIQPFWRAVLGYRDQPGQVGSIDDPLGQGPAIWFQQMDEPRPQRNRIHFDVSVPHDEARLRIQAALAAGGTLVSDAEAPAFWVLADAEGNEACITTWQGRDAPA
jgi:4a-hydroxytetrahydrobiopterin dehydratase